MNNIENLLVLVLTIIGSACCAIFLLPQFLKIVKNKSAADLSLIANFFALLCGVCWIIYLTWKAVAFTNDCYDQIILLVSSIADWGICIFDFLIVIYQLKWLKKNKDLCLVKMSVKKMKDTELRAKIHDLEKELNVEVEHG